MSSTGRRRKLSSYKLKYALGWFGFREGIECDDAPSDVEEVVLELVLLFFEL